MKKDRIVLEFKGLDTHADVYLNDWQILTADNMFRGWTADVKNVLKSGEARTIHLKTKSFVSDIAEKIRIMHIRDTY